VNGTQLSISGGYRSCNLQEGYPPAPCSVIKGSLLRDTVQHREDDQLET